MTRDGQKLFLSSNTTGTTVYYINPYDKRTIADKDELYGKRSQLLTICNDQKQMIQVDPSSKNISAVDIHNRFTPKSVLYG